MLNLGVNIAGGEGAIQDFIEGMRWIDLARFFTQSEKDMTVKWQIRGAYDKLKGTMSKEQFEEARKRSKDWCEQFSAKQKRVNQTSEPTAPSGLAQLERWQRKKMIHYHVWFNLKPEVREEDGLATVGQFLKNLCAIDEVATFQLLRNKGGPPRSKLPRYHALVQFVDDSQLAIAMKKQAARGIHSGLHGEVIDVVSEFHVEVFSLLENPIINTDAGLYAGEI